MKVMNEFLGRISVGAIFFTSIISVAVEWILGSDVITIFAFITSGGAMILMIRKIIFVGYQDTIQAKERYLFWLQKRIKNREDQNKKEEKLENDKNNL